MNPGSSVPDAELSCPPELDDASGPEGPDHGGGRPAVPPRAGKPLQDIQELIDKLAAVTQQLRRPASRLPGSPR